MLCNVNNIKDEDKYCLREKDGSIINIDFSFLIIYIDKNGNVSIKTIEELYSEKYGNDRQFLW